MKSQRICLKNPLHLLATGFGSGLCPKVPGTAGTVVALLFFVVFMRKLPNSFIIYSLVVAIGLGIALCQLVAKDLNSADAPEIVWDEFCGFWLTMLFAPNYSIIWCLAGFVLFRAFDICKPWPINWLDSRVHGGLGIMADDLAAAVYAGTGLWAINKFFVLADPLSFFH